MKGFTGFSKADFKKMSYYCMPLIPTFIVVYMLRDDLVESTNYSLFSYFAIVFLFIFVLFLFWMAMYPDIKESERLVDEEYGKKYKGVKKKG